MVDDWVFSHKIDYYYNFLGDFKSLRASKLQHLIESDGDFAELVDFARWWSFSDEGSARLQAAQQACF